MKEKILGLDIGIASVGHLAVNFDEKNFSGNIIESGVRIFEPCEVPKTKESLNAQRRNFRLARRRLKRRSGRLRELKQIFISNKLLNEAQINNMFQGSGNRIDVWDLRKEALIRKLTIEELYRIIHQIAKRRGFKSVRKSEEANREGQLLKSLSENIEKFKNADYETIGEMFANIYVGDDAKRNKRDDYKNSIPRELLQEEFKIIIERQRKFGLDVITKELENKIFEVIFYQKSIQSMYGMIGNCRFEKGEKRAPKAAYTSEIFVAAQNCLNTKMSNNGTEYFFNEEEIKKIIELAHSNSKVTYKQVKKLLNIDNNVRFNGLNYNKIEKNKKTGEEKLVDPEEKTFIELKKYHEFRKAIEKNNGKEYFDNIKYDKQLFNSIAEILTYEKSDEAILKAMSEKNIPAEIAEAVKDCSAVKVLHLSLKAMENIIPYMLEGYKYHEACDIVGYDYKNEKESKGLDYLPVLSDEEKTTNPVVNRAVAQTRKVVNALIKKYGKFDRIIIETARDLGKSVEERNKIKSGQEDFQKQKELARQRCIENGVNPDSGNNLLRFRLWEQQNGFCIYSKQYIEIGRLSELNYTDIDHILPYSRSCDDSLNNKVLCLSGENRQKGSKIPYEYLGKKVNWDEYSAWVKSLNLPSAKINRILRHEYNGNTDNFISRNLNDTRYITVFIKDYLKTYLDCKVETRNGSLTAFLRNQWGIKKIREESDRHHATDAGIIACSTKGMVKYLSTISAQREGYEFINNSKPKFKKPWETFCEDLEKSINEIFVSRALVTKIPGSIHEATLRSAKHIDEGFTTIKTDITKLNLSNLETLYDKERNYELYKILKERLEQFDGDGKKAFEKPVYMKLSEEKKAIGQKPHPIKTVKLKIKGTSGIILPNGFAKNESMPRVDVFTKKNKKGKEEYFLVPVYVADFAKGILPQKAISKGKNETIIDETFTFKFSLFKNSLISIITNDKENDNHFYYYKNTDIDSARITVIETDNRNKDKTIRYSVKSLPSIKKYQVDALGNYYEVKNEKRQPIHMKGYKKNNL